MYLNNLLTMIEINEIDLQKDDPPTKRQKTDVFKPLCDDCLVDMLIGGSGEDAVYLCVTCSLYICVKCHIKHTEHRCLDYNSSDEQRKSDIGRMVIDISKEENLFEIFHKKEICVYGVAKVRHNLDRKDCLITGITGLNRQSWVACDSENSCLKVYDFRSNVIQRYIKISAKPFDVTEVDLPSGNRDSNKKHCIGVTLPDEKTVLFLNLDTESARIEKQLHLSKRCYYLDYSNEKVFIVCEFNPSYDSPFFLMMLTVDGIEQKRINTKVKGYIPHIAVNDDLIYLTDKGNDIVWVFNLEGTVVGKCNVGGLGPTGIVVDQENDVLICASKNNKIYTLNRGLHNHTALSDKSLNNMDKPCSLCSHKGRLYVGHHRHSYQSEYVTVISIL